MRTFAESVDYERTHDYQISALDEDDVEEFSVDLDDDQDYRIVAF